MKKAVGKALKLKKESLSLSTFGVFYEAAFRILHASLMDMDFCFQWLATNEEEEIDIINMDKNALQLIFWEVKFRYTANN